MSGNTSATGGYLQSVSTIVEDDLLTDLVTGAVVGIVGLPGSLVRPRWQPTPPPQPPVGTDWAAVGIQTRYPMDYAFIRHDPTGNGGRGQDIMTRNQRVDCMVIFYGPHAAANGGALTDGFAIPQNWEILNANGIRYYAVHDTVNTNEMVNMQWIPRVDVTLKFQRAIKRVYQVQTILSTPFNVITNHPAKE